MRRLGTILSVALLGLLVQAAQAGDCGNADCGNAGCSGGCNACCDPCCDPCCGDGGSGKRCQLVVGTKKIKVICYGCECDEVCLPCPSKEGCTHCENICEDGCCGSCGQCDCECGHKPLCKVRWTDWRPGGAQMYHRKKLVKYEAEKEVCDYKWVVVDCGNGCCGEGAPAEASKAGEDRPPMPPVPTPVSTTKNRRAMPTKAAPANAKVGEEFPLTDAEKKMVESQIMQTSLQEPVKVAAKTQMKSAAKPTAMKAVKAPIRAAAAPAAAQDVPWSLFK